MSINVAELQANAQRGAEWLDNGNAPPNWRSLINPKSLNIRSPSDCPMGQVFGDYDTKMTELAEQELFTEGMDEFRWAVRRGFDIPQDLADSDGPLANKILIGAWTAIVTAPRSAPA